VIGHPAASSSVPRRINMKVAAVLVAACASASAFVVPDFRPRVVASRSAAVLKVGWPSSPSHRTHDARSIARHANDTLIMDHRPARAAAAAANTTVTTNAIATTTVTATATALVGRSYPHPSPPPVRDQKKTSRSHDVHAGPRPERGHRHDRAVSGGH